MLRWFALLLMLVAAPAQAQWAAPRFNPAADYVTAGQDELGYRRWAASASWRPAYVRAFNDYLVKYGVGGVAPTWQLLRTATDWQKCGAEPRLDTRMTKMHMVQGTGRGHSSRVGAMV